MFFSIVGVLILIYSCFNFKKGFLVYLLFQIIWFSNGKVISMAGVPSIPIYLVMAFGFVTIYIFKGGFRAKVVKFPFVIPLLILSISRVLTCFTSLEGFSSEFARAIGFIFGSFVEVVLIWRIVEEEKDFAFLIKGYCLIFAFASLYGLIEYVIKANPIIEYKSRLTPEGIGTYQADIFRGYRVMSIFEHPIGAGMTFGLFAVFSFLYWTNRKKKTSNIYIIVALLSILCVTLTKMRASILFTIIAAMAFVNLNNKKFYKVALFVLVGLAICFPIYKDYINVFLSLFSSSAQQAVGGSNSTMRFLQFNTVYNILKMSPLLGFGEQCAVYLPKSLVANALGFESIWFEAMSRYGMLGVIGNILMMVYSVFIIPHKYKSKSAFWVSLAFWLTNTLTTVPFFRMSMYYVVYFYCIKQTMFYKKKRKLCDILPEKNLLTLKNKFVLKL